MIKNVLVLLVLSVLFSCGNFTPKHNFAIIYEFEDFDNLSAVDKQNTITVLNRRLDKFASNYKVKLNNKQQIEIKLSTNFELEAVNAIITNTGRLDFWEVIKGEELGNFIIEANSFYKKENDSINPLFDMIQPNSYSFGLFSVAVQDSAKMRALMENKAIKHLLPTSIKRSKFLFGLPDEDGFLPFYVVKTTTEGVAYINETHITDARQGYSTTNRPSITMEMNKKGAERWERMTGIAYQKQSQIAMTLNDIVYSAPTASSGAIKGGYTELTGNFTVQEAQDLALIFCSQKRIPKLKFVNTFAIIEEL
ncbi:SecDF P1 head subdomain-containing protein [Psychroserpens ponticola]|uniref:SecDF P1 head subdomain domain-containing protein n=1 Tax=Psychroserpens ponticola TaxID=2932268 RepID=A0ABY7S0G7_9FLAO|nr:hypothetical protein [Psychroserpens ponticola]WCO02421.1 hypothetical protein MUN68_002755 [Psychroserpens ponticola]